MPIKLIYLIQFQQLAFCVHVEVASTKAQAHQHQPIQEMADTERTAMETHLLNILFTTAMNPIVIVVAEDLQPMVEVHSHKPKNGRKSK